jgi:hypothetical protein
VKRSLFSLALAGLALAAALPASALDTTPDVFDKDGERARLWNLAEAYPCTIGTYPDATGPAGTSFGIEPVQTYCGKSVTRLVNGATPGILAFKRRGNFLDVNCFAVTPSGATNCVVQAYRLFKQVPGSFKCPDVYGLPHFNADGVLQPYQYIQFGTGVRTWWSLNFTQPGTRFLLEVVCVSTVPARDAQGNVIPPGAPGFGFTRTQIHLDQWRWRVVADVHTLRYVIELMHGGAISTLEVPCILGEDMYDALVKAQERLRDAIRSTSDTRLTDIGNAIFDFEALIVANCLFVEVLNPIVAFPGPDQFGAPNFQPPGNLAQTVFFGQGSAVAGIIDTIENPCCCKLLVDLEWIALREGLVGQTPRLPVF